MFVLKKKTQKRKQTPQKIKTNKQHTHTESCRHSYYNHQPSNKQNQQCIIKIVTFFYFCVCVWVCAAFKKLKNKTMQKYDRCNDKEQQQSPQQTQQQQQQQQPQTTQIIHGLLQSSTLSI